MNKIYTFFVLLSLGNSCLWAQQKFTLLPSTQTGIYFKNEVPVYEKMNVLISQYHYNGGGLAIGDFNNDELQDIFFVKNFGMDELYLNKGDFQFEEVAKEAGVQGGMSWETGVTLVDINNDGWTDMYVCRSGLAPNTSYINLLYINQGLKEGSDIPTFKEQALDFGLFDISHSTDVSFFDYDRDGDLDMFMLNHNISRITNYDFDRPEIFYNQEVGDKLFRNDNGTFKEVTEEVGLIGKEISNGLGLMVGDINQDGWPDMYVCNDFGERDYFYLNNRDGTFREELTTTFDQIPYYSMGGDLADFNNDGWLDIMTLDMTASNNYGQKANMNDMNPGKFWFLVEKGMHYQYMINCLQMNNGMVNGKLSFSNIAFLTGTAYTDWSWAPLFADFDNDGLKDLFITNGYRVNISNKDYVNWYQKREQELTKIPYGQRNRAKELQDALSRLTSDKTPNYMFKNSGNLQFEDMSANWGLSDSSFSNGVAYGDLDNDGDLDLVINNLDQEAFIYRNNTRENKASKYLNIYLKGSPQNKWGIGTKVWVKTGLETQYQEFYVSRGYQSSMAPMLHFGLGKHSTIDQIDIEWPDGRSQSVHNVSANQKLTISWEDAEEQTEKKAESATYLFSDITRQTGVDYIHHENMYDDFEREVLLPHKLSTLGPALAVTDVNGDGLEDFYIGGAKGNAGKLYLQNTSATFTSSRNEIWNTYKDSEDIAAHFFDADQDGDMDLYVVSGGNEVEENDPLLQDRIYLNDGKGKFSISKALPQMYQSGGCVQTADFDGDGDEDIFVGGRLTPGKYPYPGRSYILENNAGIFKDITEEIAPGLAKIGMVTDALWTDHDQDGDLDLMIVGEWMPITLFQNQKGKLKRIDPIFSSNPQSTNDQLTNPYTSGWWYSLSQADIDKDGDMDYVAGNLGQNYKYQASENYPFEIYTKDFDENGSFDIVLGYYEEDELFPLRGRQCSSQQIPGIKEKYETYNAFATASLQDVYGDMGLNEALNYKAYTFTSVVIENRGKGKFHLHQLPPNAQISPINSSIVTDLDRDGFLDILIAGNLYGSEVETPRADAGKGLMLRGQGDFSFSAIPPFRSGFVANGNIKNMLPIKLSNQQLGILHVSNGGALKVWQLNKLGKH